MTADQLLNAIELGKLEAIGIDGAIRIVIDGTRVATVRCHPGTRPQAKVTFDGRSVDVYSHLDSTETCSVACESSDDAIQIAEALDACLQTAYRDMRDGEK